MDYVLANPGIAIVAVIAFVVFLFIAKRVLRLALRLLVVGLFIFALAAAGAWGWWNDWFSSPATPQTERPAPTRRKPSR